MNEIYEMGRRARRVGHRREACSIPARERVERAWWLAGWHDQDMEILAEAGI